jgi:AcrR family transcriptional regulator
LGFVPRPRAHLDTTALARAFAADGLHGTPIDAVATAAGIAKPTLYARGGDKEDLFALAVEAEVERLIDRLNGELIDVACALDSYVRDAPAGARLLFCTARHGHSRVAERVERALRRISLAVSRAIGGEDADSLAAALLGGAHAALDGGPPVERLARLLPRGELARPPRGIWTA